MRAIDADAFVRKIRKQHCEDCVRRKGIKNGKMQYLYEIGGVPCRACEIEDMLNEVEDAPPIQPEPHWIPVTERLPENNDPVNVTYVNHNPGNYYAEVKDKPYTATAHFHNGQWYWYSCTTQDLLDEYGTWIPDLIDKDVEITAWMPLLDPFKEVTE